MQLNFQYHIRSAQRFLHFVLEATLSRYRHAFFGYRTRTNVRLSKPRMEVDVVGTDLDGFTLAVDCKHWKRNNLSSISFFCEKQVARAKRLMEGDKRISQVVPVVLTLHPDSVRFIHGVPLVPILKFRSFLMDVKGFLPKMYVVSASGT